MNIPIIYIILFFYKRIIYTITYTNWDKTVIINALIIGYPGIGKFLTYTTKRAKINVKSYGLTIKPGIGRLSDLYQSWAYITQLNRNRAILSVFGRFSP